MILANTVVPATIGESIVPGMLISMTATTEFRVDTMTNSDTAAAIAHFSAKLAFETDVSDVHAAFAEAQSDAEGPGFVLIDTRSEQAWNQGRIPGAVHLPTRRIAAEAAGLIPSGTQVVTYCWGPGCNGSTRAALEFARLGYPVKEMIGGFEYWVREGFAYDTAWGRREPAVDPLTAPADGTACAC